MSIGPRLLYGVMLRDVVASSDIDEMRAFAAVSNRLLKQLGEEDDLESEEITEWQTAHQEILNAIAEQESITLSVEDIIAIKDGIVVIDNINLARQLKQLTNNDLEGEITIRIKW